MAIAVDELERALGAARDRYVGGNPQSERLYGAACEALPGGNTRAIIHTSPFPLTLAGSEGTRVEDVDGHAYVDLLGDFTAGLYGHSHPAIVRALHGALEGGLTRGGRNPDEERLAHALQERFPSLELVRYANSGSEATLFAVLAARAISGRPALLAFEGAYHGGFLSYPDGPSSMNAPVETILAPYNDADEARRVVAANADRLAAAIVEPLQGAAGCIPADPAFMRSLADACREHGVLLIFDEVMTSRLAPGGMQGELGIAPDLTALGKWIGGGMPFGAFGGRRAVMERFDPRRGDALTHSGTFNNDALKLAAGIVGLTEVFTPAEVRRLSALGDRLRDRLNAAAQGRGVAFQATGQGSMLGLHFTRRPVRSAADLTPGDPVRLAGLRELLHLDLLAAGYYIARRGFVSLSLPLGDSDVAGFAAAVEGFLDERGPLLRDAP